MRTLKLITIAIAALVLPAAPAVAQPPLKVQVVGEEYVPMRVAIPDFDAEGPGAEQVARDLADVLRADLASSTAFALVDKAAFIERDLDIALPPTFGDWSVAGVAAQALVVGKIVVNPGSNSLTVQFRLYDVYGQSQLFAREYSVPTPLNWRRLAHKVADDVYSRLTGDEGYFDSRIAFVSKTPGEESLRGRLAIMDQDGANAEFLLSGFSAVINPRFSPTEQMILYGAYVPDPKYPQATLLRTYLYDISTGRQEILAENPNSMEYSARFSPDGKSIAFSRSVNGNADIYVFDLARGTERRLTRDSGVDTSPSFSPDGKRIVFESDRGLGPQLYMMNENGEAMECPTSRTREAACRISFETGARFGDPVWSPRGDWIAFSVQRRGQFAIGVIQPDGKGLRVLSDGYQDEAPSWSPNGRVIVFQRTQAKGAGPKLFSVDLTGRNTRRIATPRDATNPTWGPLLK
ncbi:MAG: Tol-Pal system beta propeller repeat protein TolB [Alphaproteobacteria bacterium 32-64-14]|nr:MAG: Tol-Pal system beta propeller repeat protein TolB [Alphaproteobacteria bacterium 32-64-14]